MYIVLTIVDIQEILKPDYHFNRIYEYNFINRKKKYSRCLATSADLH